MTDDLYYRKLESTSTIDLVDMIRKKDRYIAELEEKIKHLTKHLEPQTMTALFEQVEEEVKREQRIKELEAQIEKLKPYRCENHHKVSSEKGKAVDCYKMYDCNNCGYFEEIKENGK